MQLSDERNLEDPDHQRMVSKAKRGDRHACADLVTRHYQKIYQFCYRLCGNQHDAADLTQEAFATVWNRIAGFDERSKLNTWICQIAYRKWIDEGRRQKRRTEREQAYVAERTCQGAEPAESAAMDNEEQKDLSEAMGSLPEQERLVLVLFYQQELSMNEIADITGIPVGTLKWRKHSALNRIQSFLEKLSQTRTHPKTLVDSHSPPH